MNKQYQSARNRTPQEQLAANTIDYIMASAPIRDLNLRLAVRDLCAYAADKLRQPNPTCLQWNHLDIVVNANAIGKQVEDFESLILLDKFFERYNETITATITDLMREFAQEQIKNS